MPPSRAMIAMIAMVAVGAVGAVGAVVCVGALVIGFVAMTHTS